MRQFRLGVKRDLEWLLNTTCAPIEIPEPCAEAKKSVLCFGLPDISSVALQDAGDEQQVMRSLEEAIERFEPRLAHARVTSRNRTKAVSRPSRFHVEAVLMMDPAPERISFDTVLEITKGAYSVKESLACATICCSTIRRNSRTYATWARNSPTSIRRWPDGCCWKRASATIPHVERLLEGFAFLAARIYTKIDDEFPQIVESLISVLYPYYLRPIPSASVVQFHLDPEQGKLMTGLPVPKGSLLYSPPVNGTPCKFQHLLQHYAVASGSEGRRLEVGRPHATSGRGSAARQP